MQCKDSARERESMFLLLWLIIAQSHCFLQSGDTLYPSTKRKICMSRSKLRTLKYISLTCEKGHNSSYNSGCQWHTSNLVTRVKVQWTQIFVPVGIMHRAINTLPMEGGWLWFGNKKKLYKSDQLWFQNWRDQKRIIKMLQRFQTDEW